MKSCCSMGPLLVGLICISAAPLLWSQPKDKEVEVINGVDNPVPVYDVDEAPTATPVQFECVGTIPAGTAVSGDVVPAIDCISALVPNDKSLVIEFVTARILTPPGQRAGLLIGTSTRALSGVGTTAVDHQISLDVLSGGFDSFTASTPVKLYGRPGSEVQIIVTRNQTVDNLTFDVTWSGYLVDSP